MNHILLLLFTIIENTDTRKKNYRNEIKREKKERMMVVIYKVKHYKPIEKLLVVRRIQAIDCPDLERCINDFHIFIRMYCKWKILRNFHDITIICYTFKLKLNESKKNREKKI